MISTNLELDEHLRPPQSLLHIPLVYESLLVSPIDTEPKVLKHPLPQILLKSKGRRQNKFVKPLEGMPCYLMKKKTSGSSVPGFEIILRSSELFVYPHQSLPATVSSH